MSNLAPELRLERITICNPPEIRPCSNQVAAEQFLTANRPHTEKRET
jgi:hypothetical protein